MNPLLTGRPDAGQGLLKKPSMISAAEDLQKGKRLAKDKGCLNEGGQKVEVRRSKGVRDADSASPPRGLQQREAKGIKMEGR